MSRIGKAPVPIPSGVDIKIDSNLVSVTGPKGTLEQALLDQVNVTQVEDKVVIERKNDEKIARSQHGLMRALIANMIQGVTEGYKVQLEVHGVGFKVSLEGKKLTLMLGLSHPVTYVVPEDVDIAIEQRNIIISGTSKQRVGQIAAEIRAFKKPEPYKGKGIIYTGEQIIRKAGKAAASAGGGS